MGWDLKPIEEHFVTSGLFARSEWERLLADPIAYNVGSAPQGAKKSTCGGSTNSGLPQPPEGDHNLDTLAEWCAGVPRDLEKHGAKVRELASQVQHVTAIVKRREWDVFLLAGRPDDVVIWTTEVDALHKTLHQVVQATETNPRAVRRIKHYTVHAEHPHGKSIEETDLLILDTVHHHDRLWAELVEFAPHVRRRIAIRGTQAFGELCEGGNGPGLLVALRRFMRDHSEWSVIYHNPDQYGLTVISRDPADKPTPPGVITMAGNLAKAVAAHVADGLQKVTTADLEIRMQVCTLCESRRDNRCMVCGCFLEAKAGMRSSVCPLGKWPEPGAPEPMVADTERVAA